MLATTIFPPTETLPFDSVQDAQAYTSEYDITTSQTSQEIAEELQNKEERMQSEEERSNEKASVRPSTNHNEDQIAVLQNKLNDHYEEEVEYIEFQPDEGQEKEEGRRKKGEGSMEKREESTLDEQRKEEP